MSEIDIQTFFPTQKLPEDVVVPEQVHETRIVEIVTGTEDLSVCDGIWTRNPELSLGIRTADCAPIVFHDSEKFGILHAGWRGLCGGICEKMLKIFNSVDSPKLGESTNMELKIFVGPIFPRFEIQKDFCHVKISEKFGDRFFEEQGEQVIFDFEGAIRSILPGAEFDGRSTFEQADLASWRRDEDERRNVTVVSKKEKGKS